MYLKGFKYMLYGIFFVNICMQNFNVLFVDREECIVFVDLGIIVEILFFVISIE